MSSPSPCPRPNPPTTPRSHTMGALGGRSRRRLTNSSSTAPACVQQHAQANVSWEETPTTKPPCASKNIFLSTSNLQSLRRKGNNNNNNNNNTSSTTSSSISNSTRNHQHPTNTISPTTPKYPHVLASSSHSTPALLKSCLKSVESSSTTTTTTTTTTTLRKNVSFSSIQIREHPMVLGDNPSVSQGPPVSLDWYDATTCTTHTVPLDEFEHHKHCPPTTTTRAGPNRRHNLVLSSQLRESLLRQVCGTSSSELKRANREVNRVKKERKQTVARVVSRGTSGDMALESARRKVSRWVGGKKSSKQEQEELWQRAADYHQTAQQQLQQQQQAEIHGQRDAIVRSKTMPCFLNQTQQ